MKSDKETRRKALKALVVGVPAVWAKPVVDSVVLPAHGATTLQCGDCLIRAPSTSAIPGVYQIPSDAQRGSLTVQGFDVECGVGSSSSRNAYLGSSEEEATEFFGTQASIIAGVEGQCALYAINA